MISRGQQLFRFPGLWPLSVCLTLCVYRWVRPAGAGHAAVFDLGLTHTNTVTYEYRKAEDRHVLGRHLNLLKKVL